MMQGKYEIYWRKDQNGTPNEPISPQAQATASPQSQTSTLRKGAMVAIGAMAAKRAYNVVRQEISASGNQRLQNQIDNAMSLVGAGLTIAIGGWIGAAAVGIETASSAILYSRNLQRENINLGIERRLRGKRVNIAKGSVYYD